MIKETSRHQTMYQILEEGPRRLDLEDPKPEGPAPSPLAQKIAEYLIAKDITIVPESRANGTKVLGFVQHLPDGQTRELGEMAYDERTEMPQWADADNLRQSLQLPGFVTGLRRPLAMLLMQTKGQFYESEIWDPIHDACDAVEAKYRR